MSGLTIILIIAAVAVAGCAVLIWSGRKFGSTGFEDDE